ncbi:MAG: tetratricopeptide repeat protein [Flammeovirgaceae bacterium]
MATEINNSAIISSGQELISKGKFDEAVEKLQEIDISTANHYYFLLLGKAYHAKGELERAVSILEQGVGQHTSISELVQRRNEYQSHVNKVEKAIELITNGQHTTPEINFAKSNTGQLIENNCFETALKQLSDLARARKAKTTNILWIGNYLKDLYFHPNAEHLKGEFDDLLFEEMLFYYLKACKLFEPEYKVIQAAKKALKENS